jgi:predicted transcriptional regulator
MTEITNNTSAFERFINTLSRIQKHELNVICNDNDALIRGYNNRYLVELLHENDFVINKKPHSVEITLSGKEFFEYYKKITKEKI